MLKMRRGSTLIFEDANIRKRLTVDTIRYGLYIAIELIAR
jgi:hypothetical protein